MYNAEQKQRFIKDYTTKITVMTFAQRIFDHFEPYEEQWGADVCTKGLEEIQPVFDKLYGGVRSGSIYRYKNILSQYATWCIENGVSGAVDAAKKLKDPDADKLSETLLKNPRHLQAFLNAVCDKESDQTSDNNFRTYCWLAYAGLHEKDIFEIRTSDVDFDSMLIHSNGRSYPIYREALPAIKNCVTLQAYVYRHPNYSKEIWRDRVPGDLLLRGIRSDQTVSLMRVDFSKRGEKARRSGKTTMRLSYYRVWLSGVFYRMLEDELAGIPVDFSAVVDEKLGDFQYKLPPHGNTQEYKRKEVADEFQADYERWKQTLL